MKINLNNRAFLAQMVERWPFKPMAVGSIPTEGVFFYFLKIKKYIKKQKNCHIRDSNSGYRIHSPGS